MRILVLGGTRFVGRSTVETALGRGDTVAMFNRGKSGPGLYPGVETVIGDRTEDLSPLDGREFDVVMDVACYDPAVARRSAEAFRDRAGRYVFVSSVSVYASQATTEAQLEDAPLAELKPDLPDYPDNYGANKALSEAVVREVYGDRALIGRPGLITGPNDPTDRFPYWPRRIAAGGRVLAPGDAGDLTQVIDVRDLAAFLLDACHRDRGGVYNLTGAPRPFGILLDLREHLPAVLPREVQVQQNQIGFGRLAVLSFVAQVGHGLQSVADRAQVARNLAGLERLPRKAHIARIIFDQQDLHDWR